MLKAGGAVHRDRWSEVGIPVRNGRAVWPVYGVSAFVELGLRPVTPKVSRAIGLFLALGLGVLIG